MTYRPTSTVNIQFLTFLMLKFSSWSIDSFLFKIWTMKKRDETIISYCAWESNEVVLGSCINSNEWKGNIFKNSELSFTGKWTS